MEKLTDELLARIAVKANDPKRRYMNAAEDEARIELSVEEIELREEAWTRRNLVRSAAASGQEMSSGEVERYVDEWRASRDAARAAMEAQMRAWGQTPPMTKSFIETDDYIGASNEPAGAKPLRPPPTHSDWKILEQSVGRAIPEDLKRLYAISDGGFGPGFTRCSSSGASTKIIAGAGRIIAAQSSTPIASSRSRRSGWTTIWTWTPVA
jgi:hypothetical protein